jgi:hypothetical protein
LERLRWWLEESAKGTLHREEDPPHQFFAVPNTNLIITRGQFSELGQQKTYTLVAKRPGHGLPETWVLADATQKPAEAKAGDPTWIVMVCKPEAVVQKGLRHAPETLRQLCDVIREQTGTDLQQQILGELKQRFPEQAPQKDSIRVAILLMLPVAKGDGSPASPQLYAYLFDSALALGVGVGLWLEEGVRRLNVADLPADWGANVRAFAANVQLEFDPLLAGLYTGEKQMPATIVVGAGAIGSQVADVLARGGCERMGLVDKDVLNPHNLARHTLRKDAVGFSKAQALSVSIRNATGTPTDFLIADLLSRKREDHDAIRAYLAEAKVIIDCSASAHVATTLGDLAPGSARRISCFLSPDARDLVVMVEAADRSTMMAELEDSYLAALAVDPKLVNHIPAHVEGARYGRGCGDRSTKIASELVMSQAAVAARRIRRSLSDTTASLSVYRACEDGSTACLPVVTGGSRVFRVGGWSVAIHEQVIAACRQERERGLPAETGGVLLGTWDVERHEMRVVCMLPAPPDSVGSADGFIRGCEGLKEQVAAIQRRTADQVVYLGEWHSHPRGASAAQSATDVVAAAALAQELAAEGKPALQLIVADGDQPGVMLVREGP